MPTDEQGIPTGRASVEGSEYDFRTGRGIGSTVLDTGYADLIRGEDGLARVELEAPDGGRKVSVWLDQSYPYVMAFSGDSPAGRRAAPTGAGRRAHDRRAQRLPQRRRAACAAAGRELDHSLEDRGFVTGAVAQALALHHRAPMEMVAMPRPVAAAATLGV